MSNNSGLSNKMDAETILCNSCRNKRGALFANKRQSIQVHCKIKRTADIRTERCGDYIAIKEKPAKAVDMLAWCN